MTCPGPASNGPMARVLILGGGFGGVYAALELERLMRRHRDLENDLEVTLVARDNFFLFTPMLHEVAASDLELSTIVSPFRKLLGRVRTFIGTIEHIDLVGRRVRVSHGDGHAHELPYEHLILALGARTNFFGLPGVEERSLTLKSPGDALRLRDRLITRLEEANSECAAGERQPLLTFVVAGGGFAGVETIGAINDFVRDALPFYPNLRGEHVRMVLVAPDDHILPELGAKLGRYAQRKLAARGVDVQTGVKVRALADGDVVLTDGRRIPADTLIWTAGTASNPLLAGLPVADARGRIPVDGHLAVAGWPGVWAVGDCALVPDGTSGRFHPPTAQHALREGRTVGRNVVAAIRGVAGRPFRFATLGQLAAIGHRVGVANVFGINFSGFVAWWLWRTIYLAKLPRFEKKVRVALDWTLDLCFAKDFACVTPAAMSPAPRAQAAGGAG